MDILWLTRFGICGQRFLSSGPVRGNARSLRLLRTVLDPRQQTSDSESGSHPTLSRIGGDDLNPGH